MNSWIEDNPMFGKHPERERTLSEEEAAQNMILQIFQTAERATDSAVFLFDYKSQTVLVPRQDENGWCMREILQDVPYGVADSGIVMEDSRDEYLRIHEAVMNGAADVRGRVRMKDEDGTVSCYEITMHDMTGLTGKSLGKAVGVSTDITPYQEQFHHQYAMTRALSEGVASAYYIDFDRDTFVVERLSDALRQEVTSFVKQQEQCFSESIRGYCLKFVHEDDLERMLEETKNENILKRLEKQHSYFIQYRVRENPDNHGYFEMHISDAEENFGEHKAFMSFRCIDEQKEKEIQQQKELEKALEDTRIYADRARENLEVINDIIGSGLWYMVFDNNGVMQRCYWSEKFRKMLGFNDQKDFPDKLESWSDRLHPDDYKKTMFAYWNCVNDRGNYDVRYRLKKKDGTYTWFRTTGKVLHHRNGKPRLFVGTFQDITEEREKERLQSIISSVVSIYFGSWVIDVERDSLTELSTPVYVGDVSHMGAREAMDYIRRNYLTTDIDKERMKEFLDCSTLTKRIGKEKIITIECRTKFKGFCSVNIIPVSRDARGNVTEFVLAMREINQEKKQEMQVKQALEDAYEAANRANAAKSNFLTNMSHDIRTPMNAIIGMTAIACTHIDDKERVQDCLSKITVSSRHLLGLINEVLDMSKIESGKLDLNKEDFDLAKLVDNLLAMSRPQIEAMGHELTVNIYDLEHEFVTGDSQRLQQAFTNLLSNAIKYTPPGGKIRLSITEKPTNQVHTGCFEFVFEDNGIGMTKEFQEHLFEPFSRARDTRVEQKQGTGLGMSIARNIVRMMNGDIAVESEPGKGTKFTVTIFLTLQDVGEEAPDAVLADLPVLVADDDQITCESACDMLDELGMKGEWVMTGAEAVEKVNTRHAAGKDFFAVILDWKMPGMDGVETTRAIRRAVGDEIPIIIISAYDWSEIEQEARRAGADAFISKPLFKSRMAHTFKTILDGKNEEPESVGDSLEAVRQQDFSGKRVLLAEDNALNAEIAGEILEMTGLTVEFATNGKEAYDMLENSADGYYDLVFMDIQMPIMNGYEAARAVRSQSRNYLKRIPIIAMTANAFAEDVEAARDAGMNGHIAKPIDFGQLQKTLVHWLS